MRLTKSSRRIAKNSLGNMYKKGVNRPFPGEWRKMALEKFCKDCGELRPTSEFTRDRARKDGLSFYCKTYARGRLLQSKDARKGPPKSRHPRDVIVPEGHKWCPDCGTVKALDDFVRNAGM